jgi:hypothetical protein
MCRESCLPFLWAQLERRLQASVRHSPTAVMANLCAKWQLWVTIRKLEAIIACSGFDGGLLLPATGLCLLNVGEVGAQNPRRLELQRASCSISDREYDLKVRDADAIRDPNVQ